MADNYSKKENQTADLVIIGGGPAGCAAAVCTARYGLETVLFDRGNSALRGCAFLENYLGFPAGIDIRTFYELMHDHVKDAGCELLSDMVESIRQHDDGFRIETQEGRTIDAPRVVAATTLADELVSPDVVLVWSLRAVGASVLVAERQGIGSV